MTAVIRLLLWTSVIAWTMLDSPSARAGAVVALERVSISSTGVQANSSNYHAVISADGRFVAFDSEASNLDPILPDGGSSGLGYPNHVYLRDRQAGTTQLISVTPSGSNSNAQSEWPAISADGRYIGFQSEASNLVSGDTNSASDVFVRDRQLSTTVRVSVADGGSDTAGGGTVNFDDSTPTWLSADGRYAVFQSTNLLTANATNIKQQVYRRDLVANHTELVSVNSSNVGANNVSESGSISADGRFVMFISVATDIVAGVIDSTSHVYVRDMLSGVTVIADPSAGSGNPCDGSSGSSSTFYLSPSGRYATFNSSCDDLVAGQDESDSLFVRDLFLGTTRFVRMGNAGALDIGAAYPSITNSARYVIAWSQQHDVSNDTGSYADVFLQDQISRTTYRVSQRVDTGEGGNSDSYSPSLGAGGRVVFASDASNLVDGDSNGARDIFVATLDAIFDAGFD